MTAYLYRMPVGIAGAISRPQDLTVEPVILKSDTPSQRMVWLANTTLTAFSCRWRRVTPSTR